MRWQEVRPGYFETLAMRLREGRLPTSDDSVGDTEPAVLSETAARNLIPGRSPIGETLKIDSSTVVRIIGVVQDEISPDTPLQPIAYRVSQKVRSKLKFVVKDAPAQPADARKHSAGNRDPGSCQRTGHGQVAE